MKKTTLAMALGALVFSGVAGANWYVEGNAGYSRLKTSGGDGYDLKDNSFSPSIALGYRINDWRFAVDYTYYGKANEDYRWQYYQEHEVGDEEIKAYGFGVSAYYDFNINTGLKPYVGVRLSTNHIKTEQNYAIYSDNTGNMVESGSYSDSDTKFGYGAIVGVSYNFAPQWDLNVAAEYNRLAKYDDVKYNQYGVKVGVRYSF